MPGFLGALHAPGHAPDLGGYHGTHADPGSWTNATHFSAAPVSAQQHQHQHQHQQSAQAAALAPLSDLSRSATHSSRQAAAFAAGAGGATLPAAAAQPADRQPSRLLLCKQPAREDGNTWRDLASTHPADAAAACGKYPQAEGGFSSYLRAMQFGLDAMHAKAPDAVTQVGCLRLSVERDEVWG